MQFTSENIEDIRRYYVGTYVKFKETGDALYYLSGVNNFYVEGRSHNGDVLKLYLDDTHPYEIEYVLPHKSYFQLKDMAAQLYRIPAKQYQRGIGPENTEIRALRGGDFIKMELSFSNLLPYVDKQKFYTLTEALLTSHLSCVLTPRIAFDLTSHYIYIDYVPVALVNVPEKVVTVSKKVFKDDIVELLSRNDDNFKVIV